MSITIGKIKIDFRENGRTVRRVASGRPTNSVSKGWVTPLVSRYGRNLHARDQRGREAVWGIPDANGREKRNGLEVAASKPFQIN